MRIGVIAPNLALRAGIRALLSTRDSEITALNAEVPFQVVYEGASAVELIQAAPSIEVLILADETIDWATLPQALPEDEARLAILLLNDDPQPTHRLAELPLCGWGILPLDISAEELQAALWAIHEGLVVGTPQLFAPALTRPQLIGGPVTDPASTTLTERENQVLQHLARGLANKQIALALSISEHTVKFHISSIYTKLGTTNRTEAVRAGVQRGLVVL